MDGKDKKNHIRFNVYNSPSDKLLTPIKKKTRNMSLLKALMKDKLKLEKENLPEDTK